MNSEEIAILYSGGTDSTCAAALSMSRYRRVHLLTFQELGTRDSPSPEGNVSRLRQKFGEDRFVHRLIPVDALLQKISYDRYASYVRRHGFSMLATCGFSSLSWHLRTIMYCLDNGVTAACDGVTRELMHFPGHMDEVLEEFRRLYASAGIAYSNPVRDWDVPEDRRFVDRMIVDRHAVAPGAARTTGRYLFEQGLFPSPDVKGSAFDQSMQHACYPFVLFNIFVFWCCLGFGDEEAYKKRMKRLFRDKVDDAQAWIDEYRRRGTGSVLSRLKQG